MALDDFRSDEDTRFPGRPVNIGLALDPVASLADSMLRLTYSDMKRFAQCLASCLPGSGNGEVADSLIEASKRLGSKGSP